MDENNRFAEYSAFAFQAPFDFSKHSTIGCGGMAEIAFYPRSVAETVDLVKKLDRDGVSYRVLGNLSNVLPTDKTSERAVIRLKELREITKTQTGVFAYAGASMGTLLTACKNYGKSGVEFLIGIPCTLGGALYMNAGVRGYYIGDIVESVYVLRDGETRLIPVSECGYAYKKSVFMQNNDIILGASLRLKDGTKAEIEERERAFVARRAHLPKGRSMGCVFKNPVGVFAGELIERSGLKGMRIGGAKISEIHGNFILNEDGATSAEIKDLIMLIKNAVFAQYGVRLEEEIRYLD